MTVITKFNRLLLGRVREEVLCCAGMLPQPAKLSNEITAGSRQEVVSKALSRGARGDLYVAVAAP